jgi:hypothetical protein
MNMRINTQSRQLFPGCYFDAAWTHYYSGYYYKAFDKISSYAPANINKGIRAIDVLRKPNDGDVVNVSSDFGYFGMNLTFLKHQRIVGRI